MSSAWKKLHLELILLYLQFLLLQFRFLASFMKISLMNGNLSRMFFTRKYIWLIFINCFRKKENHTEFIACLNGEGDFITPACVFNHKKTNAEDERQFIYCQSEWKCLFLQSKPFLKLKLVTIFCGCICKSSGVSSNLRFLPCMLLYVFVQFWTLRKLIYLIFKYLKRELKNIFIFLQNRRNVHYFVRRQFF